MLRVWSCKIQSINLIILILLLCNPVVLVATNKEKKLLSQHNFFSGKAIISNEGSLQLEHTLLKKKRKINVSNCFSEVFNCNFFPLKLIYYY